MSANECPIADYTSRFNASLENSVHVFFKETQTEIYVFHFINFIPEVTSKIFLRTLNFVLKVYILNCEYRISLYNFKIRKQAKCNLHQYAPVCTGVHRYALCLLGIRIGFQLTWVHVCTVVLLPLTTVILRNNVKEMKLLIMMKRVHKF